MSNDNEPPEHEAEKLFDELTEKLFVPMPVDDLMGLRDRVRGIEHRHARTFERYLSTMIDIINALSLPWNMSSDLMIEVPFVLVNNAFQMAGADIDGPDRALFDRIVEDLSEKLISGHLGILKTFIDQDRFGRSVEAINRQGAVLFYGAVEDFLLISIEIELEHDPALLRRVAKKHDNRLGSASLPLDVLIELGSSCSPARLVMETIRPKLNNLATITSICSDVFRRDFSDIMKAHERTGLMLFHLRNLIAHRGGVVDRKFLDDTKDLAPEGDFGLGEHVSIGHSKLLGFLNYCLVCMVAIGKSTELDTRSASESREA